MRFSRFLVSFDGPPHGGDHHLVVDYVRLRALKLDSVILRRNDLAGSFLWVLSTAFWCGKL